MIYNTLLVQFDIEGSPEARLKLAGELASRFGAHVIGFAAANTRSAIIPPSGVVADSELHRRELESIERRLRDLKSRFEEAFTSEANRSWHPHVGDPTRALTRAARAADLIVTGPPAADVAGDPHRSIDLGELILKAGRPVLVANTATAPVTAERVLVAWKDSREARRAVADAMPFLVNAKEVVVVTLEGERLGEAKDSAADVARYLVRHGARARADVIGPDEPETSVTLVTTARRLGADLIVSGAYGHSRLREWAFGGMTQSLLADATIARLMSN